MQSQTLRGPQNVEQPPVLGEVYLPASQSSSASSVCSEDSWLLPDVEPGPPVSDQSLGPVPSSVESSSKLLTDEPRDDLASLIKPEHYSSTPGQELNQEYSQWPADQQQEEEVAVDLVHAHSLSDAGTAGSGEQGEMWEVLSLPEQVCSDSEEEQPVEKQEEQLPAYQQEEDSSKSSSLSYQSHERLEDSIELAAPAAAAAASDQYHIVQHLPVIAVSHAAVDDHVAAAEPAGAAENAVLAAVDTAGATEGSAAAALVAEDGCQQELQQQQGMDKEGNAAEGGKGRGDSTGSSSMASSTALSPSFGFAGSSSMHQGVWAPAVLPRSASSPAFRSPLRLAPAAVASRTHPLGRSATPPVVARRAASPATNRSSSSNSSSEVWFAASSSTTAPAAAQAGASAFCDNAPANSSGSKAEARSAEVRGEFPTDRLYPAAAAPAGREVMQAAKKRPGKNSSSTSSSINASDTQHSAAAGAAVTRASNKAAMLPARRSRRSSKKQPLACAAPASAAAGAGTDGTTVCGLWGSCRNALISCLLPGVLAIVALHHLIRGLALAAAMSKGAAATANSGRGSSSSSRSRHHHSHHRHHISRFPVKQQQDQKQQLVLAGAGETDAAEEQGQPWFLGRVGREDIYSTSSSKGGKGLVSGKHGRPWLLRGVRGYLDGAVDKNNSSSSGSTSRALVPRSALGELLLARRGLPCGVSSSSSRRGCGRLQQLGDVGGGYGMVDLSSTTCYSS